MAPVTEASEETYARLPPARPAPSYPPGDDGSPYVQHPVYPFPPVQTPPQRQAPALPSLHTRNLSGSASSMAPSVAPSMVPPEASPTDSSSRPSDASYSTLFNFSRRERWSQHSAFSLPTTSPTASPTQRSRPLLPTLYIRRVERPTDVTRYEAWTPDDDDLYHYAHKEIGEDGRTYGRIGSEIVNLNLLHGQPDPQQQAAIDQFKRSRYKRAYKAIAARYPEAAEKAVIREGGSMQVMEKGKLLATSREREKNVALAHPEVPLPCVESPLAAGMGHRGQPPYSSFEPLLEATMLEPLPYPPGAAY